MCRQGSVGRGYPHFETAVMGVGVGEEGEIVSWGRNCCMGCEYWGEDIRYLVY